jgi:hypothetical protein
MHLKRIQAIWGRNAFCLGPTNCTCGSFFVSEMEDNFAATFVSDVVESSN